MLEFVGEFSLREMCGMASVVSETPPNGTDVPQEPSPPEAVRSAAPRRRWLLVLGLAFIAMAAWPAYRRAESFTLLEQARREMRVDDFAAACQTYAKLAARQASNAEAQYLWGVACRRKEAYEEADRHFDLAQKLGFSGDSLQHQRNMLRFQGSADPAAEKYLARLLQAGVADDEAEQVLEALTVGCLNSQRHGEALRHTKEWLNWQPHAVRAYWLRSKARLAIDDFQHAAEDLKLVIAARPRDAAAYRLYADVLFGGYEYEQAYQAYCELERLEPGSVRAILGRGRCAQELGQSEEAKQCLELVLQGAPDAPERAQALMELARIEVDARQPDRARELLEQALAMREDDVTAHTLLASVLARLNRLDEAVKHRDRAQELTRNLVALSQLKQAAIEAPDNPELLWKVGQQYLLCNRPADALGWLEAAVRKTPDAYPVQKSLADCWERLKQPGLAEQHRKRAAALKLALTNAHP